MWQCHLTSPSAVTAAQHLFPAQWVARPLQGEVVQWSSGSTPPSGFPAQNKISVCYLDLQAAHRLFALICPFSLIRFNLRCWPHLLTLMNGPQGWLLTPPTNVDAIPGVPTALHASCRAVLHVPVREPADIQAKVAKLQSSRMGWAVLYFPLKHCYFPGMLGMT